jgi:hypothetical protein
MKREPESGKLIPNGEMSNYTRCLVKRDVCDKTMRSQRTKATVKTIEFLAF